MIKSVTVTNHVGESIKLELGFPEKSGFLIQSIEGLGPVKATINTADFSVMDGSLYSSARLSLRNIVFTLALLEKPTVENTRQLSYKYFPVKKRIRLLFESDNRLAEIYGYVESNEPDIFSKQETTQISIICPDPYLYSRERQLTLFSGFNKLFQFPWSNESITEELIEVGEILKNQSQTVYYTGDGDIGVEIELHVLGEVVDPVIYNTNTGESMKINTARLATLTGSTITLGDAIFISTIKGAKAIQLFRDGVYYNILNCLDKNTSWFQLTKGDNVFLVDAEEGFANLIIRIENQIVYEGI